jgi:hypothetical protein
VQRESPNTLLPSYQACGGFERRFHAGRGARKAYGTGHGSIGYLHGLRSPHGPLHGTLQNVTQSLSFGDRNLLRRFSRASIVTGLSACLPKSIAADATTPARKAEQWQLSQLYQVGCATIAYFDVIS